ncbi:MAG TPA: Mov34/MPN/PAD-1 family protein [Gemmatimonadaceae bacterium]|jgi:hypothetical protein|nr:Mov34/MPN/PAD-1 family protein [Gemmatimonadaceae bacterium]
MGNGQVVYLVPQRVLDDARHFFRERGGHGFEGTGLLAGRSVEGVVQITRLVVPEQVAFAGEYGCAVDLTPHAHYTLPDLLTDGEQFYARIHSHPARAYHSDRDNANEVLSHEGAISIVVPHFARDPISLDGCAIYELSHERGWVRLRSRIINTRFRVTQ